MEYQLQILLTAALNFWEPGSQHSGPMFRAIKTFHLEILKMTRSVFKKLNLTFNVTLFQRKTRGFFLRNVKSYSGITWDLKTEAFLNSWE